MRVQFDIAQIAPLRDALISFSHWDHALGSDYGVTELLQPPRIVQLKKRYRAEIAKLVDPNTLMPALRGVTIHSGLEYNLKQFVNRHPGVGYLVERKLSDKILGRRIAGKFDVFLNGALYDFKTTSVWKFAMKEFDEYEEQLNVYAHLLRTYGVEVSLLYIIFIFTDWDKAKAWRSAEYPKAGYCKVTLDNLWTPRQQEEFLVSRVQLQVNNEGRADHELDLCTAKEMWSKPTKWAVQKVESGRKAKKASRLLDSEQEAKDWAEKKLEGAEHKIEYRPGQRMRCEGIEGGYCNVARWCSQFREYLKTKEK